MNRALRIFALCALGSATACTSPDPSDPPEPTDDKVAITAFRAAPDSIEAGQTAMLRFTVEPADAQVTITEVGEMGAQTEVPVHPTTTTTYHLTAIKGTARAEASITVTVAPQPVVSLLVTPGAETAIAGQSIGVTLTAIALNGLPTPSYRGTVKLSSSDSAALIGGEVIFGPADNGVKSTKLELRTAGLAAVSAIDINNPGLRGAAAVLVKPAAASVCNTAQVPSVALAGSTIGLSVVLHDPFGNLATGYSGTIRLTTTDVRAPASGDVTYTPGDAGSHVFSAVLITAGPQMLAATDTANSAIHCEAGIMVAPGIPKIVLTAPGNAKAGFPLPVNVQIRDVFDNAIPGYAGTVSFTSSDGAAAPPAPIAFTGSEGGMATTAVTFLTRGTQMLDAHDAGSPVATGSAVAAVVGLVYTAPASGRVRLVANAAQSTAQIVQLDMIANERIEVSNLQGARGSGPGSFATGMNLPLDTTRVDADTALIARGAALPAGAGVAATAAAIGTDHVLYAAVSRKRVSGSVFAQATEVQAGQVFYSVRLKLSATATVGPVFDGAQPSPMFRASVRDQYGDDFVGQTDFGIGRLEVQ